MHQACQYLSVFLFQIFSTGSILTMVYLLILIPIYLLHKVLGCDQQDQVDKGKERKKEEDIM